MVSRPSSAAFGSSTTVAAKMPRVVDKFAEGRSEPTSSVVQRPVPVSDVPIAAEVPIATAGQVATATNEAPVPQPEKVISELPTPPQPAAPSPRNAAILRTSHDEKPEPKPDAEGVIRANWPVIKGPVPIAEPPAPILPPPSELMTPTKTDSSAATAPTPTVIPPALPPGVIGTSHHQSNASPAITASPILPVIGVPTLPPATAEAVTNPTNDTPLIRAIRAFQLNRPNEAIEHLKGCDPIAQQALLSLVPAVVRLSASNFQQIKPDEMDVILDQLAQVPSLLRSRASLRVNNVKLCREVHNFGHVEPFPIGHQFHPGDIVYLYMELANFTCTPDPKVGYTIAMASGLEMLDAAGHVVWRADPKEIPDTVSSPPQDYYRNFRMSVPGLSPGTYTLTVKTIDRPTAREVTKAVELRIGAK